MRESGTNYPPWWAFWALPPELWHSEFLVWLLREPSCQIVLFKKSLEFSEVIVVSRHLLRMGVLYGKPDGVGFFCRQARTTTVLIK